MELALQRIPRRRGLSSFLRYSLLSPIFLVLMLGLSQTSVLPATFRLPNPAISSAATRDERWREDLHYLASQLTRLHANAFFTVSRSEFDHAVNELDARIPAMSDHEIALQMLRLVAMIGDGHTQLFNYQGPGHFQRYPIQLQWFGDELYVVGATPHYRDSIGLRVVEIGELAVDDAYRAVIPYISHYNEAGLRKMSPRLLATPEVLHTLGVVEELDRASFVLEDERGRRTVIELEPNTGNIPHLSMADANPDLTSLPLYLRHRNENYWYTYIRDSRTLYFQYNSAHNMEEQSFHAFSAQLFAYADSQPIDRVVVDLRFNTGGNPYLFNAFLRALDQRPDLTAPGRLYAIIGTNTFSAGVWHAVDLRERGAVLIGEPTSGSPNGYGRVRRLFLPHSRIGIQYSTRYWRLAETDAPPTVIPDLGIEANVADYLAGRDLALEAVLSFNPQ